MTSSIPTMPKKDIWNTKIRDDRNLMKLEGRAIAQTVSRWFPTAAAWFRARSGHVGFVVDKVALEQVSSRYLCFPCQSSFHQFFPSS
jgi:hypothetical protein